MPRLNDNKGKDDVSDIIITSALTIGNVYITFNNFSKLIDTDKPKQNGAIGLITGSSQLLYGLYNFKDNVYNNNRSNESGYKTLNIIMGSLAIASSIIRLVSKQPTGPKILLWNIFCLPLNDKCPEIGLTITRKIKINHF